MIAWLRAHRRASADALDRLLAAPFGSLLTVLTLAIAIALPLAGAWLLDNLASIGGGLARSHEVTLFLAGDAGRADIAAIERRLKQAAPRGYRFVSREAALADLQQVDGMAGLLAGLTRNPLPDAFVVQPPRRDAASLAAFAAEARAWPKVALVQHDAGWAKRFDALLEFGGRLVGLLALVLAAAVTAVTFNTLRLQVADRREEIEVALLVGATRAWVARPALWFGVLQGALGGLLAVALVFAARHWLAAPVAELAALYGGFRLQPVASELAASAVAAGIALNWLGAWLAVAWTLPRSR